MSRMGNSVLEVVAALNSKRRENDRFITGIAGPPASGKTTLARRIVNHLNQKQKNIAALLPFDGFHLDNALLAEAGFLSRKGAPQTFDFRGFQALLSRVKDPSLPIYYPTFDRSRDLAIAGSGVIKPETEIVIVEGNYLLLDVEPWVGLSQYFDHTVFIEVPVATLRKRLMQRWVNYGYNSEDALERANSNDIPNALLIMEKRMAADQIITPK